MRAQTVAKTTTTPGRIIYISYSPTPTSIKREPGITDEGAEEEEEEEGESSSGCVVDQQAAPSRPKRRATNSHIIRYLQTRNPGRLQEKDLKRALEASLEDCPDFWPAEDTASCSSSDQSNGTSSSAGGSGGAGGTNKTTTPRHKSREMQARLERALQRYRDLEELEEQRNVKRTCSNKTRRKVARKSASGASSRRDSQERSTANGHKCTCLLNHKAASGGNGGQNESLECSNNMMMITAHCPVHASQKRPKNSVHRRYKPVAKKNMYLEEVDFFHEGIMQYIVSKLELYAAGKLSDNEWK